MSFEKKENKMDSESMWREAFDLIDTDNSGFISSSEIRRMFNHLGYDCSEEVIIEKLENANINPENEISFENFLDFIREQRKHSDVITKAEVQSLFNTLDIDRSGYLTAAELEQAFTRMGIYLQDMDVSEMVALYDVNGDNQIPIDEFEGLLRSMGFEIDDSDLSGSDSTNDMESVVVEYEKNDTAVVSPEDQKFEISTVEKDLKSTLSMFDFSNTGMILQSDLEKAAQWLKSERIRNATDPDTDPALHWNPNREKKGLGKYIYKANHIAIIVSDVGRSTKFYADVMGFQQIRRPNFDKHGAWFTMGNVELHLIKGKPVVHSGDDLIVGHISIETYDIGKVPKALKELGIPFRQNVSVPKGEDSGKEGTNTERNNDKIVVQYFFRDPDGYYIEVCNCMLLTEYCLGSESSLPGYTEGVKPLSLDTAILSVNAMQKWASMSKFALKERQAKEIQVLQTDGSIQEIARSVLNCMPATTLDIEKYNNFITRWTVYGDICQNETEDSLKEILLSVGNDAFLANELMHLKSVHSGKRVYQPPAFYGKGGSLIKPPSFLISLNKSN